MLERLKQKRYFKKKLHAVQCAIYDLEFKRFKTLEIREGIRKEYDQLRSRLEILSTQIKAESEPGRMKEKDKDNFGRLEDQKVLLEKDVEKMQKQMAGLDIEVHGSKPTSEIPEGHNGQIQQLDGLRELVSMIREYIKVI